VIKQLESPNLRVISLWSFSFSDAPEGNKTSPHSAEVLCSPQGTGKMSFPRPEEQSKMIRDLSGHWWLKIKLFKEILMF